MIRTLIETLDIDTLDLDKKGVISLIGAGGKTSLMFQLAKEFVKAKNRVLTTTTTKIFLPQSFQSPETIIENEMDKLIQKIKTKLNFLSHFSAGKKYDVVSSKIKGFSPEIINQLWYADLFNWIIVEADGSRQKPFKASGPYEPVIPDCTTHLILVAGLDVVGKILDDNFVHRAQIFSNNTGLAMGKIINEQSIAESIDIEIKKAKTFCCPSSIFVILNKAETIKRANSGKRIATLLKKNQNIEKIITISLKNQTYGNT